MNESDRADLKAAARILTSQGELSVKEADRIAATLIRVAAATTPKQEAVTAAVVASPDAWGIEFLGELLPELYLTEDAAQHVLTLRAVQYGDGTHRRMVPLFRAAPASTIPRVADHLEDGGKAK